MDFKKLRTFRAAAQFQNFSDASAHLGYVQSAVTNQIKALEDELQTRLFKRTGRGVALTEAGLKLQQYCEKLFNLRDEATLAVKGDSVVKPVVRIAGYETLLTYRLPEVIRNFHQTHPNTHIQVQPVAVKQLRQLVLNEAIDVALIFDDTDVSATHQLAGLKQQALGEEPVVVVASPKHPLVGKADVSLADLAGETLLLTEQGCYYRNRFEKALIQAGAMTGTLIEFTSIEAIKACVAGGTGIAAISKISVQSQLDSGEIAEIKMTDLALSVGVLLVTKPKTHNHSVNAFIRHLTQGHNLQGASNVEQVATTLPP